jgi:hypothetical protein
MARLRDGQTIFGALEGGQLAQDFGELVREAITDLHNLTGGRPKAKEKGEVTLKVKIAVDGSGSAEIAVDLEKKTPKAPRATSFYWIDAETGALSTEHPQQQKFDFGADRRREREAAEA